MNFRNFLVVLFFVLFLLPINSYAQSSNAGFVQGNIWYSKDPFEEGDKIKIYTLIFNPDQKELSGMVSFFDKTTLLGSKNFSVPATTAKDVSISWTATVGDHTIFAKIENAKFLLVNGQYQKISLAENQTENSERAVSKKIVINPANTTTNSNSLVSFSIPNISKLVGENTPDIISKPFASGTNAIEKLRQSVSVASENKKGEIKNKIEALNKLKVPEDSKTNQSKILKPLKYIELFFLYLFSLIFNNRLLFYPLLILVIFFLLRYFWRLFF